MAKKKKRGNCYVTCEALYHLLGGKKAGLVPCILKINGETHWYLEKRVLITRSPKIYYRTIIDPTVKQFWPKRKLDYSKGRGCGFLTKKPSKRAQELMQKMVWQGDRVRKSTKSD